MKLEPTDAQRVAMAKLIPAIEFNDPLDQIDALFVAANSIPEGAPVGTIARRPDGIFLAVRKAESSGAMYWQYWAPGGARIADGMPLPSDADSWPVIYDPDEYHEGDKPRLERLMREPSVFDADPTASADFVADHQQRVKFKDATGRKPRVVDRLGVDEQGSPWENRKGAIYWFEVDRWYNQTEDEDIPFEFSVGYEPESEGPYTEILEPRVLPSLDCEEARDGTVWEEPDGWRFWFNGEWRTDNGTRGRDLNLYQPSLLRLSTRSYTEVLPDVG